MDDHTVVQIVKSAIGGAILVASIITGRNGVYIGISLFLLGVPLEKIPIRKTKKETE